MGHTSVIVVNYGSSTLLIRNLLRLTEESPSVRPYVVDNLSTQQERLAVVRLCQDHGWRGVFPDTNTGFGAGCNLGAAHAIQDGAERLLFLNPDAYIDPGSLALLEEVVTTQPTTLAAPTIVAADGSTWSAGVDVLLDKGQMRSWSRRDDTASEASLPWLSGACLMLSTSLWCTVGGFDPDYFLYWEDVDLSVRVQRSGGQVRLVAGATAVHDEGATHRGGAAPRVKSPVYYFYNVRNRILFAHKNLDSAGVRRWRRAAVGQAHQILLRGGRRQFLMSPTRCLWPASKGLLAGERWIRRPSAASAHPHRTESIT